MPYRLNIQSDVHCEEDELGFGKYVDTLSGMIRDKDFKTPFCIGIFGKWGSGKTSFMHLLEKRVTENATEPQAQAVPVWFNPWRYEKEAHLIIPFLKTIEYAIKQYLEEQKDIGEALRAGLSKARQKICDVAAAFAYGIKAEYKLGGLGISLDVAKQAAREEQLANRRIAAAKALSDNLSSIYYDIVDQLKKVIDENTFRIVVFVDDLDRCLPEKAIELLEAIKLFLDIKGYLFVLGVDRDVVKKGIAHHYKFYEKKDEKEAEGLVISPDDYLEKMIQLPLELPTVELGRKQKFIASLLGNEEDFSAHADIIEAGVGEGATTLNPRTLKRFINLLVFTVRLAEEVKAKILAADSKESNEHKDLLKRHFVPLLYIKWAVIVLRFPEDHKAIKGNWRRLIELQEAAKAGKKGEIGERLKKVLVKGIQFPEDEWLIDRFIHLTESTILSEKEKAVASSFKRDYKPGDMVTIPAGKFLYGGEKVEEEIPYDYEIDVFPVTHGQYQAFIKETDHEVPYVEEDGAKPYNWDQKTKTHPKGLEDHPVVLVSYKDALAFCAWRSKEEEREVRLPTEKEWEKAARGRDGRMYPWGEDFDKAKCNTKESGIALTTPVIQYSGGVSPFGCYDMAGNVWEWTDSWYNKNKSSKVLRGGAWGSRQDFARCADRFDNLPESGSVDLGFRCVRTLK